MTTTTSMRRVSELLDLSGRVALVTGGAGHIGLAIGQALVELGATVAVSDCDQPRCDERAAVLCAHAGRTGAALGFAADLGDEGSTRALVAAVGERCGRLDILVHNAGFTGTSQLSGWNEPFARQSLAAWRQAMAVNLDAVFVLAQAAAPLLQRSPAASMLLIGSIYGVLAPQWSLYEGTAMCNPAAYNASKGGLIQMGRYLASTLAPVRVNCISPGGVARGQAESFQARYVERTPLKRMAREEDFKGAVAYLAGDAAGYVTGQNLLVDGGWSAW